MLMVHLATLLQDILFPCDSFLRQRVSESLFWEALPLSELLEECEMRGVSVSDAEQQADDARTTSSASMYFQRGNRVL